MIVSNEIARELLFLSEGDTTLEWEEDGFPLIEVVREKLIDTSRWSHIYERVYKDLNTGKYWITSYRTGATESQDERPYEYDGDEIEFTEVVPRETIVIKYVVVS